jgi:ATP phosphoribosyltransferase regulatory subunit
MTLATTTPLPGLHSPSIGAGHSQVPHGVQDRFLAEAARQRQAEAALRECFARWSYQEVIPPTLEYYENLIVGASAALQQAMYRLFDHEGRMLALRADFTPQVARMVATKLFNQPMPLRCFYVGSLFRHEEPQAGRQCEFTQAGVELVGTDTPAADAEVVALAIAAMGTMKLCDFQVNLGQMAFFRALTGDLPTDALGPIRKAIDQKNSARLADALDQGGVTGAQRDLLHRLPDLIGGLEVLDEARTLSAGLVGAARAAAAIERLAQVYRLLQAYGVAERVILDLGEVRGMDYYTGITFRGVAPGMGWPIASGGRYDDLIAHFGRPLAAVGFGLGIERALLVQTRREAPSSPLAPHVLMCSCDHPACLRLIARLRQRGCRVETDVLGLGERELAEQARQRGIARTLRCLAGDARPAPCSEPGSRKGQDETWLLTDERGARALTDAALLAEAERWHEKGRT